MHGEYKIRVKNSRNSYSFTLRRNLTILRGESGRGKTTLFDMIREYNRYGKESGVSISSDRELIAIEGDQWEDEILRNPGKIVIIDEDSHFIRSKDFAETVKGSDNYYLLITRNYLEQLPVSVDEIYRLFGTKNKRFEKIYTEIERMYDATQNSEFKKYRKDTLANYYLQDRVVREIEKEIPGLDLKESEDK